MARVSYGPKVQARAKHLLRSLLAYANNPESKRNPIPEKDLSINWRTEQRCVVRTKVRILEKLSQLPDHKPLTSQQIRESLKCYEDFLNILQDHRMKDRGSEHWHFTLNLWHPHQDGGANLSRFDTEWKQRKQPQPRESPNGLNAAISPALTQKIGTIAGAPNVSTFYGRTEELETLRQWMLEDRCRLVAIVGMGGIGKTALAAKFAYSFRQTFDQVIWKSLLQAPPLETLLSEILQTLVPEQNIPDHIPDRIDTCTTQLLKQLRLKRCLLVLDNLEAILQNGELVGICRAGYEGYEALLKQLTDVPHQSIVVLTSRYKTKEVFARESVKTLQLRGLQTPEGEAILHLNELCGTSENKQQLIESYEGNPLALKLASASIRELFDRKIATFLQQGTALFLGISNLLDKQFEHLSPLEQQILYWLAINRDFICMTDLQNDLISTRPAKLLQALESVQRRSLIEQSQASYTLQPVVMEYVTERFIDQIVSEVETQDIKLFNSHALVKVQAKDYVRETQIRLIVQPVIVALENKLRTKARIEIRLEDLLATQQQQDPGERGYLAGNILNLFRELKTDLSDRDFSNLTIWQADLRGLKLHRTNFANAKFDRSSFTQKISSILAIAFSPDGNYLAAGDTGGEIYVWQVVDGQIFREFKGHTHWIFCLAFSPDGKTLVSGCGDKTVKYWNAATEQLTEQLIRTLQCKDAIFCVVFSPDGQTVAIASGDGTIEIRSLKGEHLKVFRGHTERVCCVAYSPDGRLLASGGADQTVKVWDVDSEQLLNTLQGHTNQVRSVAFGPDEILVSSSEDQTIKRWDFKTGYCIQTLSEHTDWVDAIAFSADKQLLASASEDKMIKLWDAQTGKLLKTLGGHRRPIRALTFHPQSRVLASGAEQSVNLWDADTGQILKTFQGFANPVHRVVFSSDGQRVVSAHEDSVIRVWNQQTEQPPKTLEGHAGSVRRISFALNNQLLASCSNDHTVKLWNVDSGQLLTTFQGHQGIVWAAAFSADDKTISSCSADQTIKVWDASQVKLSGENVVEVKSCLRTLEGHQDWVVTIDLSPECQMLASGSFDKTIKLWNSETGEIVRTLQGHTSPVLTVCFDPSGQLLASGSDDLKVKLWDIQTGDCLKTLNGHTQSIWSICFINLEGREIVVTGSADKTIKLWDVETGEHLKTLEGHTKHVLSVSFHDDSQRLVSGSADGTIKLWDVQTDRCLRTLEVERPYEGMNIARASGLTEAQKQTLSALGAIAQ
ncbi:NB-ARC domain-containing protein [Phormidesmis sp. 146-12]